MTVSEQLQSAVSEKEQLSKLFTDFKSHFATIKSQCSSYQQKLVEEITTRKIIEQDNEQRMQQMRNILENKQKEIDLMNQKI